MSGANLLFAFDAELDIDGKLAQDGEQGTQSMDMHQRRTLVIACAARVDLVALDGWRKRRRLPQGNGIDRLNVVVAVHQYGWRIFGVQPVGVDDRMSPSFHEGSVL